MVYISIEYVGDAPHTLFKKNIFHIAEVALKFL